MRVNLLSLTNCAMNFIYSTLSVLLKSSTIFFAKLKSSFKLIFDISKALTASSFVIIPLLEKSNDLQFLIIRPLQYSKSLRISSSK